MTASAPPAAAGGAVLGRRRGLMLVLSSPSGAGKTTISRELLRLEPDLSLSVSVTTRTPRPSERDGIDYHFIDAARFHALRDANDLLESAEVFGNFYGTPRQPVDAALAAGQDVLFDVDWQGTQQLRAAARSDLVSVFILPPSGEALEQRLNTRAQDSAEVIARRMARAADEISHWSEYDYAVVNAEVADCVRAVQSILHGERLKRDRQTGLPRFVQSIQAALTSRHG
ncbi:MAG: guanylate kinase [Rhodospirillaceae bacterium]|nr:guanylate kinase [Rhodospirillaceae bacterium]